jgi:Bacterial Ig domain
MGGLTMRLRLLLLAAAALALPSTGAQALCTHKPYQFHPEQNDGVVVSVVVDQGSTCTFDLADKRDYTLDSITFERMPRHGKIVEEGRGRYVYTPAKDYRGKDITIFEICGSKDAAKGCSALAFMVTVRGK